MPGATEAGHARPRKPAIYHAMRSIYTLLELLWEWAILPCLNVQVTSYFSPSARDPELELYRDCLGQALPRSLLCTKPFIEILLPMKSSTIDLQPACWTRLATQSLCISLCSRISFWAALMGRLLYDLILYTGPPINGREINVTRILATTSDGQEDKEEGEPVPQQALRLLQSLALARGEYGLNKAEVVSGLRRASQSLGWVKKVCTAYACATLE